MTYKTMGAVTAAGILSLLTAAVPFAASAQYYAATYGSTSNFCPSPYNNSYSCPSGIGGLFGAGSGWFGDNSSMQSPQYNQGYYMPQQQYSYPQQYQQPSYAQPYSYGYMPQYSYGNAPQQYSYGYAPSYSYGYQPTYAPSYSYGYEPQYQYAAVGSPVIYSW